MGLVSCGDGCWLVSSHSFTPRHTPRPVLSLTHSCECLVLIAVPVLLPAPTYQPRPAQLCFIPVPGCRVEVRFTSAPIVCKIFRLPTNNSMPNRRQLSHSMIDVFVNLHQVQRQEVLHGSCVCLSLYPDLYTYSLHLNSNLQTHILVSIHIRTQVSPPKPQSPCRRRWG